MTISERLFETAIQDLNSAEILYNSKHYNLALFHLQQSVEKFVKSFGTRIEIIKPEDISKKIKHLPHKVFTKLYQNQIDELSKYNGTPILVPDMIPPHQRGKSKIKEKLDSLKGLLSKVSNSELLKIKEIPSLAIERFIDDAKELEKEPTFDDGKLFAEIKDDFIKTNEHFIEFFKGDENIKSISEDFISKSDVISKNKLISYKEISIKQSKYAYVSFVWVNLSLVTAPHEQSTRYPSIIDEDYPKSLYNKDHNLIKHIPQFIEMMRKSIKKYKEVYDE
ncbi:HEPN domain-containing protein [Aquimarina rubra]|uniref:HEPN domain-containing protein n=1 Tax=Aquimarina rubra TaxID=1920033 RepID=A0ABW5LAN1_9FLAO